MSCPPFQPTWAVITHCLRVSAPLSFCGCLYRIQRQYMLVKTGFLFLNGQHQHMFAVYYLNFLLFLVLRLINKHGRSCQKQANVIFPICMYRTYASQHTSKRSFKKVINPFKMVNDRWGSGPNNLRLQFRSTHVHRCRYSMTFCAYIYIGIVEGIT